MAQAMLKRKSLVSEKAEDENGDGEDHKRFLNANLLTTMYPLNNSWTKKIIVGFHYDEEKKSFSPLIQFLNSQYTHGLHVSRTTWVNLQNQFTAIDQYFETEACRRFDTPDTIRLDDIDVFFTTSFGTKSVVFDRSKATNKENPTKRRKTCPPTVIMQKRTFQGLKRTVTCIDERFFRLDRVVSLVNKCKDFIKNELALVLEDTVFRKKDADATVRDALKENANRIQDKLKKEFEDSNDNVFLEHYFNIVYLELTTIYHEVFSYELAIEMPDKKIPNTDKVLSPIM